MPIYYDKHNSMSTRYTCRILNCRNIAIYLRCTLLSPDQGDQPSIECFRHLHTENDQVFYTYLFCQLCHLVIGEIGETLIWSHTCQFVFSWITTVIIHYSFSLPLHTQNSSFPQIFSSIVLLPFHSPDWLHGLQVFFVFLGHVGFNFGIVCYAKLASSQLLSAH